MATRENIGVDIGGDAIRIVTVWDPLIRLVHWSLALLVPAAWWTAERHDIETHLTIGYAIMFLVMLRLYWGIFGSETARFTSFVAGPSAIRAYLSRLFDRGAAPSLGHNPLGALSVILLLALLAAQVILGLYASDVDGLNSGPLAYGIDFDLSRVVAKLHGANFNLIVAAIVLHLAAIAFYAIGKRQNLVGPMITGRRRLPAVIARQPVAGSPFHMLAGVVIAAGVTFWVRSMG